MDFQKMKRKELQALCKKHSIPANLSNSHMALNLSALLHQDQKNKKSSKGGQTSSCKVSAESVQEEDLGMITFTTRQSKKVRFSDNNEMFEYVKLSYGRKMPTKVTTQTKSVMKLKPAPKKGIIRLVVEKGDHIELSIELRSKVQASVAGAGVIPLVKPSVEMSVGKEVNSTAESVNEIIAKTVRVTRSSKGELKASTVTLVPVTTKQQPKKDVDGVESVEEIVVACPVRVMPSSLEGGDEIPALRPHVEKKRCGGLAKDVVEPMEEVVVACPVRVTRSRAVQTSVEIPALKSQVN